MALPRLSQSKIYDCIIIGAGPAGLAAALQLKRAGFSILLIEKHRLGGFLRNAQEVENYLGFLKISGEELCKKLQRQLQKWKIPVLYKEVLSIQRNSQRKRHFLVHTISESYPAKTVIVATGTKPKKLSIKRLSEAVRKKILYELAPLLRLKSKKRIGIIGGGDLAFDYALHLREKHHKAVIFASHRISCLPLLLKRCKKRKLACFENTEIKEIKKQGDSLILASSQGNFAVDYVLVAIGRKPLSPPISHRRPQGLYYAGDVHNGIYRQANIAAGDGLKAAMKVIQMLSS